MSALDSVSPTDAELTLNVFKTLRGNQSTSPRSFIESEYERCGREWKRAHDQTEIERAFHCLYLLGYARESDGYYILIDPKVTANVVMRTLLKNPYTETKKGLNDFRRRDRYFGPLLGLAAIFFFGGSFAAPLLLQFVSAATYLQLIAIGSLILLSIAILFRASNLQTWYRHGLSNEKEIAVMLVNAYDVYMDSKKDQIHEAANITGRVAKVLQRAKQQTTRWITVSQDRIGLSKIGDDLMAQVIPAVMDKNRDKAKIGEVLIRLACLFFDSTSESIRRAPELYKSLPVVAKVHAPSRLRTILLGLTERRLGQLSLSIAGAFAAVFILLSAFSRLLDVTLLDLARQNVGYVLTAFAALLVGFLMWLSRRS